MRRLFCIFAAVMLLTAGLAFAQAGNLSIYADPLGNSCNLADDVLTIGLISYYVVHTNAFASASQFSAPAPACYFGLFLSDTAVYPVTIGGSQTGVAVGYGACIGSPNNVLIVNYFSQGLTGPCCYYPVLPDPLVPSGKIEVVDCNNNLLFANGGEGIVNATPNCDCTVATEESTWGKVKALYSE